MISIITSVHNALGMNRLFYEYLRANTCHDFELIVVDNNSRDGSAEFFQAQGAVVIRNDRNYSYPVAQNQGVVRARHDLLAFLNNDVLVSRDWDRIAFELMARHGLDVACCAGTNRLATKRLTRPHLKRWQLIKAIFLRFGTSTRNLRLMHRIFFLGNFDGFCRRHRNRNRGRVSEGMAGFAVLMTRRGWDLLGPWDERIQAADFDIALRAKQRALTTNNIKPLHLLCEVYLHHFMRLTVRSDYEAFADRANIMHIASKWPPDRIRALMRDADRIFFESERSSADFEWRAGDLDTIVAQHANKAANTSRHGGIDPSPLHRLPFADESG